MGENPQFTAFYMLYGCNHAIVKEKTCELCECIFWAFRKSTWSFNYRIRLKICYFIKNDFIMYFLSVNIF